MDELRMRSGKWSRTPSAFEGRWNWWYSSIADAMIANPSWRMQDIADYLDKHINTISQIVKTDLFQSYLAERKREWREQHDATIVSKTTAVAEKALDLMLETMEKKRTAIPFESLRAVSETALDRLGYSPRNAPAVQVNNFGSGPQQVLVPVGKEALEEAREIMRRAEARSAERSVGASAGNVPQIESHAYGVREEEVDVLDLSAQRPRRGDG